VRSAGLMISISALDQGEAARPYPPGSVGAAFQVYIRCLHGPRAFLTHEKIQWPEGHRITLGSSPIDETF
jgi:hypothetical protein